MNTNDAFTLAENLERQVFFVMEKRVGIGECMQNFSARRLAFQYGTETLRFKLVLHSQGRGFIAVRSHIDTEKSIAGTFANESLKIFPGQVRA